MSAPPHPSDALLSFVYGELSTKEAEGVQRHVEGCASCAATVEGYRAVRRAATALPREIPTDAGLDSLLHYGAQAAARARRARWARWGGPLLGALAAVALVFFLQPPRRAAETEGPLSTPPAVGPLAQNNVSPPGKLDKAEPEEGAASLRRGTALQTGRQSAPKAAKAKAVDEAQRARDEVALSEARDAVALKKTAPAAARPVSAVEEGGQRADVASAARGASAAGAPLASAPSAPANQPALAQVQAAGRLSGAAGLVSADAGSDAQRLVDEGRRKTLLVQLEAAPATQRLPLLSELCAVEVRLGRRADAERTCAQVEEGFPGTPEAAAAQRALESLHKP